MPDDSVIDPLALRWVEAGVSGLARQRDWDAVELVRVPELDSSPLEEVRFGVLADRTVVPGDDSDASPDVLEMLAARLGHALQPPFEALAARQTRTEWSLAGRELRMDEIVLPPAGGARELVVARGPERSVTILVDGVEEADPPAHVEAAAGVLERLASARHRAFVARARHVVGDRWAVSVDPL